MMTPEDHRDQHWDDDNESEKMSLSDALSIVDDYLVFNQEHDNFKEALQIVSEAAEDYNYFANGESRQSYRAKLTGMQSRARQEGRNENRTYIEKAICKDNEISIYGDYKPDDINELNITFKGGEELHLEPVTYGHWELPEPDCDEDGYKIPPRVVICSNCQKPNSLPVSRYCSECGSRNEGHAKPIMPQHDNLKDKLFDEAVEDIRKENE